MKRIFAEGQKGEPLKIDLKIRDLLRSRVPPKNESKKTSGKTPTPKYTKKPQPKKKTPKQDSGTTSSDDKEKTDIKQAIPISDDARQQEMAKKSQAKT